MSDLVAELSWLSERSHDAIYGEFMAWLKKIAYYLLIAPNLGTYRSGYDSASDDFGSR